MFIVDGTWSQWTPWSLCSKTCGHQEEVRTRVCENQRNGGSYCSGHNTEVMPCNDYDYIPCPGKPFLYSTRLALLTLCLSVFVDYLLGEDRR